MNNPETIAVLVLGGAFDATELGDNDIELVKGVADRLQVERVNGFDEVHVELIERAEFDALQSRLNAVEAENERLSKILDPDLLSNIIRESDGSHSLGAGALAEKIVQALEGKA